jgi:hypothetical protein
VGIYNHIHSQSHARSPMSLCSIPRHPHKMAVSGEDAAALNVLNALNSQSVLSAAPGGAASAEDTAGAVGTVQAGDFGCGRRLEGLPRTQGTVKKCRQVSDWSH